MLKNIRLTAGCEYAIDLDVFKLWIIERYGFTRKGKIKTNIENYKSPDIILFPVSFLLTFAFVSALSRLY